MRSLLRFGGLAFITLLSCALGAQAAPQAAAPIAPPPPAAPSAVIITRPEWARLPDGDDIARYYPERAWRERLGGKATIECMVDAKGQLYDCTVVSETPPDAEFGLAALRMARIFRLKPQTRDGIPVDGGRIRIPIVFNPPDPNAPSDEPEVIPIDEVVANLAKTVPVDGSYVLLKPPGQDLQFPGYFRLPKGKVGKGTVELSIFAVARSPQLAIDGPWLFSYTRVEYDCGRRRSRVIGNSFFRPDGQLLASPPRDQAWHPSANGAWEKQIFTMACGGKPVPGPVYNGVGEVIAAVRAGEGLPPPAVPPVPAG